MNIKKNEMLTLINFIFVLCVMATVLWINPGNTDRYIKETIIEAEKIEKEMEEKKIYIKNMIKKLEKMLKGHVHKRHEQYKVIIK